MSDCQKPKVAQTAPFIMEMEPGTYYWCACGRSSNQPFCDGSHEGTGIEPVKREVGAKKKIAWCGCKYSKKGAQCDGTHSNLPEGAC